MAPIARAGPVELEDDGDRSCVGGVRGNCVAVQDDEGWDWDWEKSTSCSAYRCISSGDMTREKLLRRRNWSSSWLSSA